MSTIRWHTEARRQPQIIGRDSAGKKIPGGPYTIYQVAGLGMLPLLGLTQPWWGAGLSPLVCWLVVIPSLTAASVWLLGKPDFSRNPFLAAASMSTLLTQALTPHRAAPTHIPAATVWGTHNTPEQTAPEQTGTAEPAEQRPAGHTHQPPDDPPAEPRGGELQLEVTIRPPQVPVQPAPRPGGGIDAPVLSPLQAFLAAAQPKE